LLTIKNEINKRPAKSIYVAKKALGLIDESLIFIIGRLKNA